MVSERSGGPPAPTPQLAARLAVGVDIGGTKIEIALVRPDGSVASAHRHPTAEAPTPVKVSHLVRACVETCQRTSVASVEAVGVGIAAQVDPDGTVFRAPNLGWEQVPLGRLIREELHRPCTIANDVQVITFGEWKHGAGRDRNNLLCVYVGTGVGGGIVAAGRLLRGSSGSAGEIGHTLLVEGGRPCHCGARGCLEAYAGGWAIAERAQELARADPGRAHRLVELAGTPSAITAQTVAAALHEDDAAAIDLINETERSLAAGLASAVNLIDPGLLLLGGGVLDGIPELLPRLQRSVPRFALAFTARALEIRLASLGPVAGVIGAASLARSNLGERP